MNKQNNGAIIWALLRLVWPLTPVLLLTVLFGVLGFVAVAAILLLGATGILLVLCQPVCFSWTTLFWCLAAAAVLRGILRYAEQLYGHYLAFKLLALLREKIFSALRMQAFVRLNGREAGQLVSTITADVDLIEVFYAHTLPPLLIAIITSALVVCALAYIAPALALIAGCAYIALGLLLPWWATVSLKTTGQNHRRQMAALTEFFLDTIRGMREIVLFQRGNIHQQHLQQRETELNQTLAQLKKQEGSVRVLTECLVGGFNIAMLLACVILVGQQQISFSEALLSIMLLLGSYGPVLALSFLSAGLPSVLASGQRILVLMQETPAVEDVVDRYNLSRFAAIDVDKVSYAYPQQQPILDQVSLHGEKGKILGIHGQSGSGKTTLLQLMLRFFDPQSGFIQIDGRGLEEINTENLRENTAYLTQQTHLFNQTIRENIVLGHRQASDEAVIQAAKQANIHERIRQLPQGYNTLVAELGQNLSDGEKQRIGLARVFLHNAPVIFLDEPTSNIDSLNEALILRALVAQKQQRLIILVSHRLSTLSICDEIYHLDNGHIAS